MCGEWFGAQVPTAGDENKCHGVETAATFARADRTTKKGDVDARTGVEGTEPLRRLWLRRENIRHVGYAAVTRSCATTRVALPAMARGFISV